MVFLVKPPFRGSVLWLFCLCCPSLVGVKSIVSLAVKWLPDGKELQVQAGNSQIGIRHALQDEARAPEMSGLGLTNTDTPRYPLSQ